MNTYIFNLYCPNNRKYSVKIRAESLTEAMRQMQGYSDYWELDHWTY
jgi:hypothetical protein